jgi:hypothetical protein
MVFSPHVSFAARRTSTPSVHLLVVVAKTRRVAALIVSPPERAGTSKRMYVILMSLRTLSVVAVPRLEFGLVERTKESAVAGTVVVAADAGAREPAIIAKIASTDTAVTRTDLRISPILQVGSRYTGNF